MSGKAFSSAGGNRPIEIFLDNKNFDVVMPTQYLILLSRLANWVDLLVIRVWIIGKQYEGYLNI
jgi:hypothetical protein